MSSRGRETEAGKNFNNIVVGEGATFTPSPKIKWGLFFGTFLTVIAGAANTCLTKYQNRQYIAYTKECYDSTPPERRQPAPDWWDERANGQWSCYEYFQCPLFQTLLMYFGEWFCQWIWVGGLLYKKKNNVTRTAVDMSVHHLSITKPQCPFFWWIIPTILDWFGSFLIHKAFNFSFASAVQLLRNFNIIVYGILTIVFYKTALRVRHWTGFSLVLVGLVLTSVFLLTVTDPTTSLPKAELSSLAIVCALCSTSLHTIQMIFEEQLLRKYFCSPFEAVGWMGLFGGLFTIIMLTITQFAVPNGEHITETFYVISNNSNILGAQISFIFSISIFNLCGLVVTKFYSSGYRNILAASRGPLVWFFEVCASWAPFDVYSFFGMVFLASGSIMYQSHFIWNPCPDVHTFCSQPQMCCAYLIDPDMETDDSDASITIRAV